MSDSTASLRRQIDSAGDLQAVVRTMKAMAASNIGQFERSVRALADYNRSVELGLSACFRESARSASTPEPKERTDARPVGAVVFGSDQGLVGQFNDVVVDHAVDALRAIRPKPVVWAVGERAHARLCDAGLAPLAMFTVPSSIMAIAPLVGRILMETEAHYQPAEARELYLFYNRRTSGAAYAPVSLRLLPLDEGFRQRLAAFPWPTKNLPEILGDGTTALRVLIREYLFISLFRACAESLASENGSRLSAMERADKNINELLESLNGSFHRLRQSGIDEELFDVVSGFEALAE